MEAHLSPGPAAAGDGSPPHDDDVVELRLALVCYGGVSLAVYMHGITKELHKLVVASDALDHALPPPPTSTEAAYADLIARLAAMPRRNGSPARTRAVIDIVAGTSAGGINGVCLARALAQDASQDAIRDLWIEHADIGTLLQPGAPSLLYEAWPHVARAWPGARDAIPAPDEEPPPAREGLFDRLRRRLREEADDAGDVLRDLAALGHAPPSLLRGEVLSQRVHAALAAMPARTGGRGTLMPAGHELELFVTATDLAGVAQRVLVSGQVVADTRHRHVFVFRRLDGARNQFTDEHVPMLSFAARATSSFPAAFRPTSLATFAADIGDDGRVFGPHVPQFFRPYLLDGLGGEEIAGRWFVDGGVLDNKPFDHAVSAIRRRRADHEVRRCLVYVEPDPGTFAAAAAADGAPSAVRTMYRAASTIPLEQSILQQVLELRDQNERARRLAEVVRDQAADVADDEGWDEAMGRPQAAAGAEDPVYRRLRIRGVVDTFAQTACKACDYPVESNHAFFVREIVRCWARRKGLFEPGERGLSRAASQFLSDFDVGYTRRRLRFLIDGVSGLYARAGTSGYPTRRQLDAGKRALYDEVDRLDRLVLEAADDEPLARLLLDRFATAAVAALFPPDRLDPAYDVDAAVDRFVREGDLDALHDALRDYLRGALPEGSLDGFAARIFEEFGATVAGWTLPDETRAALLGRFARFATWDPLTYPIRVLSDVGERDVVEVVRMSPSEALLLGAESADEKLRGSSVHHFGAFFRASWRQQDYLWGRLDAAEQLVRLLVADVADAAARPALERAACRRAFAAILDEEEPSLPAAADLVADLRARLASL